VSDTVPLLGVAASALLTISAAARRIPLAANGNHLVHRDCSGLTEISWSSTR
jgi:hypothetical protein